MTAPIIYTSPYSIKHDTGTDHPENAGRIEVLENLFQEEPFVRWQKKTSSPADLETILLAHDEDYIFFLQDKTPDHGLTYLDADTALSPISYDAAFYAAGAVCMAVDDVVHDETDKAFVAVRPPGHHAETNRAMGFCLLNNIFIGARYAQEKHSLKKIAIIDFDVHHGNGTDNMARKHNQTCRDKPILYISTHGYPLFPMTGDPQENTDMVKNIRLPLNCGSIVFRQAYEHSIFPLLDEFKPDLLMLSCGFDAHEDDPLGNLGLQAQDYSWLVEQLCTRSNVPIIATLEGGYNLSALKECVANFLMALAQDKS